ncbi:MAG TPA: Ldh family oxidoreductase [Burkholderiales bacterium]|nr:Ldh family oxidoreductase [Burkholderiales bacterium]
MHRFPAATLQAFVEKAFQRAGLPEADAHAVAALMVEADLQGSEGHGIFRLPQYIRRLRAGGINPKPRIRIERERAATALVHGDNGMGHLVMKYAAEVAIEKARSAGSAWVGARWSNHAGPASLYARMPMRQGMIGQYLAVGNANHLPPWGGVEMLLSTNPMAVAIPALEEPPVVLDMATTVAAFGKVKTRAQRGEPMPEGWMIDRDGHPLTDARRMNEGFLLPLGGHEAGYKGYGMALVFGLLAGTLNGAAMGREVIDFNADDASATNTGQAILAIDIDAFGDKAEFLRSVDRLSRDIRGSARMKGFERIFLPGEQSHLKHAHNSQSGVPVPEALLMTLNDLGAQLGIGKLA